MPAILTGLLSIYPLVISMAHAFHSGKRINDYPQMLASALFHLIFRVRRSEEWSVPRRACAGIVNYFKYAQRSKCHYTFF
uniref:Uncharacterized protein n=1 Tax=Candidatus Kentrum eta TaxID=2126337 RepID=A0A450V8U6_9GAMM|nr:MAG: hypothetical protein BECKH772A_GA0070896_102161 [Candidatus Kentron sp. H]VFK01235.1 MAG: hypothetical protein BECKH772B_GA0070898_102231 [Candidatus Kentron sp. H]VFK04880.1 MAG: hypothetical protein BECKH772C_GA0070978_102171 [Candidatus Kentron sp. H]